MKTLPAAPHLDGPNVLRRFDRLVQRAADSMEDGSLAPHRIFMLAMKYSGKSRRYTPQVITNDKVLEKCIVGQKHNLFHLQCACEEAEAGNPFQQYELQSIIKTPIHHSETACMQRTSRSMPERRPVILSEISSVALDIAPLGDAGAMESSLRTAFGDPLEVRRISNDMYDVRMGESSRTALIEYGRIKEIAGTEYYLVPKTDAKLRLARSSSEELGETAYQLLMPEPVVKYIHHLCIAGHAKNDVEHMYQLSIENESAVS